MSTSSLHPYIKKAFDLGHEEGPEGAGYMRVRSPFTPTLSPLEKGGEGVRSGGFL